MSLYTLIIQTGPTMQSPWSNYCNGLRNDPLEIFSTYYIYLPIPVNANFVTFISLDHFKSLSFYHFIAINKNIKSWEFELNICMGFGDMTV